MNEALQTLLISGAVNLARSFSGWLENSLKDGFINAVEWGRLGATTIKIAVYTALIYFGADGIGLNVEVVSASIYGALIDYVESNFRK